MTTESISNREFALFQGLMRDLAGIHLPPSKKPLVCGRLLRRVRQLRMGSFGDYFRLIASGREPAELQRAVDLLTTHETYFFRESRHFDFLVQQVLPHSPPGAGFRAWSAASSSGEEAYSIAMVLMEQLGAARPWEVFGSDIGTEVLDRARSGIYGTERIQHLPAHYLRRYCQRGVGRKEGTLRIDPALRSRVRFAQVNLNSRLPDLGLFDVIFLRNVLIYFDQATKRLVVERLVQQLKPDGWLFIGHSESLNGISDRLRQAQPTIYRRIEHASEAEKPRRRQLA